MEHNSRTPDYVVTIGMNEHQEGNAAIDSYDVACPILNGSVSENNPVLTQRHSRKYIHPPNNLLELPPKAIRCVGEGEPAEIEVVVGKKEQVLADVTEPKVTPVRRASYVLDETRFRSCCILQRDHPLSAPDVILR